VRLRALKEGKIIFMAVPRLTRARCFIRLDPRRLGGRLAEASTIGGAMRLGVPVLPKDVETIDLVVAGSVAVHANGGRVGKGGGYSDLEWALARELGLVTARTPVLSTVHDLQVLRAAIPMTTHDVPVDLIVTPTRVLRRTGRRAKPRAIRWDELDAARIAAMPPIAALAR
jgi:5-formyltetrahydrofolate cyclo-ligase